MDLQKARQVLNLIADATETGYSSVYTFATKELCNKQDRQEVVNILRQTALSLTPEAFEYQRTHSPQLDQISPKEESRLQ